MMNRITSAITQLILALSGAAAKPVCLRAAPSLAPSQPSILSAVAPSPKVVTTGLPASPATDLNDRPDLVRKSLTRSQSVNLLHGPTKMWNWQVAGSAETEIWFFN